MILSATDQMKLNSFWQYCLQHQYFNISYPESADFDYSQLERFLRFSINNCGDWSEPGNYLLNTFAFEREVMSHFAGLYRIAVQDSWGYVTNGGTEGNMFACYLARELFPNGTLYYSRDSHYSVMKIARLLKMRSQVVASLPSGEIDCNDLLQRIAANRGSAPIIFANIGTTLRGAVDDIADIRQRLALAGFARDDYYLHADAALSGMILPFVGSPQPHTFADGIDSISVSGHKMIGSPIPCGIVLARRRHVERISVEVDYIAARDRTISGSRNGHSPLILWAGLRSRTHEQWCRRVQHCLHMAEYAVSRLRQAGIAAWRHANSVTVVFPRPSEPLVQAFGLAASGHEAHLIAMPHHREPAAFDPLFDALIADRREQLQPIQVYAV
ncbi:histidine decarboxylase [Pseudomonas sp. NCCP-436]|uniref:histidine decarboxylase n=1 Tax=Pseudomonas sp. NCCP-436 TaxID=2842481 RepID=UPI001C824CF8|nr:histidine decarboxylase [Pseudomonas sp. NCCP-436]GIZ12524.1 histidine decarboxylase [Pseudomonas sp. NCCP-436]